MKTRIILLVLVSIFTLSFTTTSNIETPTDPVPPEVICITISDISDLEKLDILNDLSLPYDIEIEWIGNASWQATQNFQQIRALVRANYENHYGKSKTEVILGKDKELWSFDGTTSKSNVEATMESDPNVDVDDD